MREKICRVIVATTLAVGLAQSVSAQTMSLIPRSVFGGYPTTFFDACNNMSSWPTVGARTSGLGSFTHDIAPADDATLSACIANINSAGMTLTVEAASFQGDAPNGCGNVDGCYAVTYNTVSRLISLGMSASQIRIRMQEPLTTSRIYGCGGCSDNDVVNYTVIYLQYLRSVNRTGFVGEQLA